MCDVFYRLSFPGKQQGVCEAEGAGDEAENISEEVRPAGVAGDKQLSSGWLALGEDKRCVA